jgi:hypothetical protein
MMEDKRGTKRSHSTFKEGSSLPSGVLTPLPMPSGSPPLLGSLSEVSSLRPCSPIFEQGRPFEKIPAVNLSSSSDEVNLIPDTSWDEEFTKRLFGDLNRGLFGPPGDGKVIILSDPDEEEEVHEGDVADAEPAPSFVMKSPTPTASAEDADDTNKGHSPDRVIGDSSSDRHEADSS